MKIKFFQYVFSFITFIFAGILIFDNILLPIYVGYINEVYLPDVRGEYLYKFVSSRKYNQNGRRMW